MEEQQQSPADNKANAAQRQERSLPDDFLEQVHRIREQVIQDSKGELFEDSAELIRREREKRSEYLMQVISGEYGKDPYEEDTAEEQS
jgi:ribosome-binding protein aMBF1 (putative translation factor)